MLLPIFISHYKKLTERKKYLHDALLKEGFNDIFWKDEIDRDSISEEDMKLYNYNPEKWNEFNSIWETKCDPRKLSLAEIANAITHIKIYKHIIDNKIDIALILEDDVILLENFKERLEKYIEQLKKENFDTCFIGTSFGWDVNNYRENNGFFGKRNKNIISPFKNVYPMGCGFTADAYLISLNGAKKIYENIIPFVLPIDWMFNPIFVKENVKNYWGYPGLVKQGSFDVYKSSAGRDN